MRHFGGSESGSGSDPNLIGNVYLKPNPNLMFKDLQP
jgi:hypothetical protein